VAGGVSVVGLAFAGPILYKVWRDYADDRERGLVAERGTAVRGVGAPVAAAPPAHALLSVHEND